MSGQQNVTNQSLPIWFFVSYALYILVQYPVSASFPTTFACYGILLPASLVYAYQNHHTMVSLLKTPVISFFLILFAYVIFHASFFALGYEGFSKTAVSTLSTVMFFLSSIIFFTYTDSKLLKIFFIILSSLAGIGAVVSIYLHFSHYQYTEPRLIPIGRADHQILGSLVYGVAGIVSLYLLATTSSLKQKWGYMLVMLVIGYMVFLTQSRMPLFAYTLCLMLGIILFAKTPLKMLLFGCMVLLIAGVVIIFVPVLNESAHHYLSMWLERGDSFRLALWQQTIEKISVQPWWGYGMQAKLDILPNAPMVYSPHNLYLATAFYIGLPAALVFVTAILSAVLWGLKHIRKNQLVALSLLLMIQGCLAAMVDFGQLVKSANPLWIIFWLPIAMAIASVLRIKHAKLVSTVHLQSQEGQVDEPGAAFQLVR